jgi:hypothetical protein
VILDTSLLVLLVVGLTSKRYIPSHKKLAAFSEDDFELLEKLLSNASELLVTPNTLSEASNLLAYIGDPAKTEIMRTFRAIIQRTREAYAKSSTAANESEFLRLGLTDCAVLVTSADEAVVLTADLHLYLQASRRDGERALNFNHYRAVAG